MIKAEVHSDDRNRHADFDATPWFESATEEDIIDLADSGWGSDYKADEIARWCSEQPGVEVVLDYAAESAKMGFDCNVNEHDARQWLDQNA